MRKNGGPAFPRPTGWNGLNGIDEHGSNEPQDGMTLRDYFAAAALQGTLAGRASWPMNVDHKQILAQECYGIADAMLAENAKG